MWYEANGKNTRYIVKSLALLRFQQRDPYARAKSCIFLNWSACTRNNAKRHITHGGKREGGKAKRGPRQLSVESLGQTNKRDGASLANKIISAGGENRRPRFPHGPYNENICYDIRVCNTSSNEAMRTYVHCASTFVWRTVPRLSSGVQRLLPPNFGIAFNSILSAGLALLYYS